MFLSVFSRLVRCVSWLLLQSFSGCVPGGCSVAKIDVRFINGSRTLFSFEFDSGVLEW